jgi:hypothetical protein
VNLPRKSGSTRHHWSYFFPLDPLRAAGSLLDVGHQGVDGSARRGAFDEGGRAKLSPALAFAGLWYLSLIRPRREVEACSLPSFSCVVVPFGRL